MIRKPETSSSKMFLERHKSKSKRNGKERLESIGTDYGELAVRLVARRGS